MEINLEALEAKVLNLSLADRTHLLERLVASLDADTDVETQWCAEAEYREQELQSGAVTAVDSEEVLRRLRAMLETH
jgi:putative addiction module component (TIGR02574 family)